MIGLGGHAKNVIDVLERQGIYHIVGFLDIPDILGKTYKSYEVIGNDNEFEIWYKKGVHLAFISIGYMGQSRVRNRLYEQLKNIGYHFPNIVDPTAIIAGDVILGEGNLIGKQVVVNADTTIGKMCIINTGALIEHECMIGDFSHIAVRAVVCGNVKIGKNVFVGANSTIIQGLYLGNASVIGAATIITKDVKNNTLRYRTEEREL